MTLPCRLGGVCELISRDALFAKNVNAATVGIAQCVRCSQVYEAVAFAPRACAACGLAYGTSLHDPCLGTLPEVFEACCGHGDPTKAYRLYVDGRMEVGCR